KNIEYGYYHGYTLFDKKGIKAHFPFGFGLSYTDFEVSTLPCEKDGDVIRVRATVKNIGEFDGDEVLQVYVGSDNKDIDRPVKVLKGFKRVSVKAGEALTAEIDVLIDDIKFYNAENGNWELDESYTVYVGTDSKNVAVAGKISF
ncbi:MAG: fibronectin type III-like domain-contianing protein, partial [Clostridia bacterium]|nr:fibronectin type III-like domain-contianing protein [Clostridia bacterium]